MTPESWSVVLVASAFVLVGIAVSPLAWVALLARRSRFEREIARQVAWAADELRALQGRMEQVEASVKSACTVPRGRRTLRAADETGAPGVSPSRDRETPFRGKVARENRLGKSHLPKGPHRPRIDDERSARADAASADSGSAPTLIAVPSLAAPAPRSQREATINGISHRYAAIWSLADSGASADVIARATGQPIGQIELIMGLRRQIDATRNKIAHDPLI
jgi:hypothetical protein